MYRKREFYKLWDECLKGNGKPMSARLEGWSEDEKLEMFYQALVSRYSNLPKKNWDAANNKLKMFIYFDIFERVAEKRKTLLGKIYLKFFKIKSNY